MTDEQKKAAQVAERNSLGVGLTLAGALLFVAGAGAIFAREYWLGGGVYVAAAALAWRGFVLMCKSNK